MKFRKAYAMDNKSRVIVVPCSGIGKVHGLISRESAYEITDNIAKEQADTLCLALLVKGDEEALAKVRSNPCITIDGCAKYCAKKNIEIAGGKVAEAFIVNDALKSHRGEQPGTATKLTDTGWTVVREIACCLASDVRAQSEGGEK